MRASEASPRFWNVDDGKGRRWTVRSTGFGGHVILNSRGQVVSTSGATGRRILAAVRQITVR